MKTTLAAAFAVLAMLVLGGVLGLTARVDAARARPLVGAELPIGTTPADIQRLIQYDETLVPTARQLRLLTEGLHRLPSACMMGSSAADRCCGCNLGRATWGLAKYLLIEKGYEVQKVWTTVESWKADINPKGFSIHRCVSARCYLAMREDGCGGMHPKMVTY